MSQPTPLNTSIAYMKGYFAHKEKVDEADNPYMFAKDDYFEWRRGWYQARKDVKPPIWKCSGFWTGLIFILLGMVVVGFEIPVIKENPRLLGAAFATYGIGSIILRVISGQSAHQPIIIPPLLFSKQKKENK